MFKESTKKSEHFLEIRQKIQKTIKIKEFDQEMWPEPFVRIPKI